MERKILILVTVLTVFTASKHQACAQSMGNKSNGILEIISLHIPDSVIFKPAKGIEIESWKLYVSLVSDTTIFWADYSTAEGVMKLSPDGFFSNRRIFLDETEKIRFYSFKAPSDFEAKKVKFVVDGKEMIYDLVNFEWESSSEKESVEQTDGDEGDVDGYKLIKYDGVYYRVVSDLISYLRFYEDGTAINVSSTGTIVQIKEWFNKDNNFTSLLSKGRYIIEGNNITFQATNNIGTVDYNGQIYKDKMILNSYSHISGHSNNSVEYLFSTWPQIP